MRNKNSSEFDEKEGHGTNSPSVPEFFRTQLDFVESRRDRRDLAESLMDFEKVFLDMRRRAYLSAVAGVSVAGCSAVGGAGWGSDGGQRRADLSIVRRFFDSGKKPAVHVRVTNNSDVPANTIEAKADWLDEQGDFIGTSREDLTELPGQWTWQPGISPLAPIDYAHDVELRLDYADGEANPSEEIELQLENTKDGARRSSTTVVVENTGDEEESLRAGAQFFEEDELILAEKHQLNILPPGITWRFDVSIQTVREVSARAVATRPY